MRSPGSRVWRETLLPHAYFIYKKMNASVKVKSFLPSGIWLHLLLRFARSILWVTFGLVSHWACLCATPDEMPLHRRTSCTHIFRHSFTPRGSLEWKETWELRGIPGARTPRKRATWAQDWTGHPETVRRQTYLLCYHATHWINDYKIYMSKNINNYYKRFFIFVHWPKYPEHTAFLQPFKSTVLPRTQHCICESTTRLYTLTPHGLRQQLNIRVLHLGQWQGDYSTSVTTMRCFWMAGNGMYAWNQVDRVEGCLVLGPVSLSHTNSTPDHEMTPIKLLPSDGNDLRFLDKGYVRKHIANDIRATVHNAWR